MSSKPTLITASNFDDHDGFYSALLKTHKGLSEIESQRLNTRLVLILANHIGDKAVLEEALELAGAKNQ